MNLTADLKNFFKELLECDNNVDTKYLLYPVITENCWFFFDIIIKSLILYMNDLKVFEATNRIDKIKNENKNNHIFLQFNEDIIENIALYRIDGILT